MAHDRFEEVIDRMGAKVARNIADPNGLTAHVGRRGVCCCSVQMIGHDTVLGRKLFRVSARQEIQGVEQTARRSHIFRLYGKSLPKCCDGLFQTDVVQQAQAQVTAYLASAQEVTRSQDEVLEAMGMRQLRDDALRRAVQLSEDLAAAAKAGETAAEALEQMRALIGSNGSEQGGR